MYRRSGAGRDVVVIESVGAGQSEVEIAEAAEVCVVVNAPNLGDDVQAIKAGILEIPDVLVVNKADLPLAQRTTEQLKNMLKLRRDNSDVPVIETTAIKESGIGALDDAITGLLAARAADKSQSRERRMRRLIAQAAGRAVADRIRDLTGSDIDALVNAAASGDIGVAEAVSRALKLAL